MKKSWMAIALAGLIGLGGFAVAPDSGAQPGKNAKERRENRKDRREDRKDRREDRREDRKDRREDRREDRKDRREDRMDRREDRREDKMDRREDRRERRADRREDRKEARHAWWQKHKADRADRRKARRDNRKEWAKKRADRRRDRRRAVIANWGATQWKKGPVKAELEKHARREAHLERAHDLATEKGDEKLAARIDELLEKEQARHEKHMQTLTGEGGDGEGETE